MPRQEPLKRKVEAACNSVLERSPTTFGKLVALAGLMIRGNGQYSHAQLESAFPGPAVNAIFQKRHEDMFAQWMNLGLEEQHKELTEFFCSMWTVGRPRLPAPVRHALAPLTAREAERSLFLSDLECNIGILEAEQS